MNYYAETDGHVFLVKRGGLWKLPMEDELPFSYQAIAPLPTTPHSLFVVPALAHHPENWPCKDDLPQRSDVDPLVKQAIHATMPRVVVEAVCRDGEGNILLAKSSRGLSENRWSLPGGFLRFGESPADGIRREIGEELQCGCVIGRLIRAEGRIGSSVPLHWIMLFYQISLTGEPTPDPDEIAEIQWFAAPEAAFRLGEGLMQRVVEEVVRMDDRSNRSR
ncbi:NUDIX hydrolase [Candidatus Bipolaricaulota bacterium]|nr:NUDIX hydrolase [Candidatus Bipolaricaulota bacterium]